MRYHQPDKQLVVGGGTPLVLILLMLDDIAGKKWKDNSCTFMFELCVV